MNVINEEVSEKECFIELELFRSISQKLEQILKKGNQYKEIKERKVMYIDIVNYIIRTDLKEKVYTDILLWCTMKIRSGVVFVSDLG